MCLLDYRRTTTTVVIPALNEAENLPFVLPRIPESVDEVILVDGHSTDDTIEVAKKLLPRIRIIRQEGKGKGAALRTGFAAATSDIVVMLDADGSTDPAEIPAFVGALLAGADFAKGSRFLQGGGTDDMPFLRRLGNGTFVALTNLLFRTRFSDITYGYNAAWRTHRHALALEIDGWSQEIISNIRAARAGLRVTEIPSFENRRIAGEAKLETFSAGWVILKSIIKERFASTGNTIRKSNAKVVPQSTGLKVYHQGQTDTVLAVNTLAFEPAITRFEDARAAIMDRRIADSGLERLDL